MLRYWQEIVDLKSPDFNGVLISYQRIWFDCSIQKVSGLDIVWSVGMLRVRSSKTEKLKGVTLHQNIKKLHILGSPFTHYLYIMSLKNLPLSVNTYSTHICEGDFNLSPNTCSIIPRFSKSSKSSYALLPSAMNALSASWKYLENVLIEHIPMSLPSSSLILFIRFCIICLWETRSSS
jgi:hypothetical protein